MTFLDKIRALDKAATPGPFPAAREPNGPRMGFVSGTGWFGKETGSERNRADAMLHVLLRNALPEIAALVEAAKSMLAYDDSLPECEEGANCEGCACAKAIRAALSRLDARAKENA